MLNRKDYAQAATCFANADSWFDLAYVLERVMSVEELNQWLLFRPDAAADDDRVAAAPRNLAARRFMREARFDLALRLFPESARRQAEVYIHAMRQASDADAEPEERARHFWRAARIMRNSGLALFGSELGPDQAWSGGGYDWPSLDQDRARQTGMFPATEDEQQRVHQSQTRPNERFHYRYRAAQLAELAAGLLPNNDVNAARIYCIAGGWLKARDPRAADRFYKQLVVRCPDTRLGQLADAAHWFPSDQIAIPEPFGGDQNSPVVR